MLSLQESHVWRCGTPIDACSKSVPNKVALHSLLLVYILYLINCTVNIRYLSIFIIPQVKNKPHDELQ
jgi:hypothetical protein